MKELLLQIAAYRYWANKRLMTKLSEVPEEVLQKNIESSFGSIASTLFHIVNADFIWWQRLQLKEHTEPLPEALAMQIEKLSNEYLKIGEQWILWIENSSEQKLQHVIEYRNSKREAFKQPVFEILLHVFNHQTYHHGQIITMLRQQHIDKLPATDVSVFARTKRKN